MAIDFAADCITAADFDLDGSPECVLGRDESVDLRICRLLADEQVVRGQIRLDSFPVALAHADFDLDGRPELAVATIDGRVLLFISDGTLSFSCARTISLSAPACDLDVCMGVSRPLLTVATRTGFEAIDPTQSDPELPAVSQTVVEAAERIELFARPASFEDRLMHAHVSTREREVLGLAMNGMTARDIGSQLFIAERTVESHLAHAYGKLGVRSRFELLLRLSDGHRSAPRT